jgi:hypothetical protein
MKFIGMFSTSKMVINYLLRTVWNLLPVLHKYGEKKTQIKSYQILFTSFIMNEMCLRKTWKYSTEIQGSVGQGLNTSGYSKIKLILWMSWRYPRSHWKSDWSALHSGRIFLEEGPLIPFE